jgi:hypothetical protein
LPGNVSRRRFFGISAGAAGGVLGAGIWTPAQSEHDDEDDEHRAKRRPCPEQNPIVHINKVVAAIGGFRFFFPGPADGSFSPVDKESAVQPTGRDPSTIFDFDGVIGQADLELSGTGTDTTLGKSAPYTFHTDTRFIAGQFVGTDFRVHHGAFAFI